MKLLCLFVILYISCAKGIPDFCPQRIQTAKDLTEKCSKQLQKLCGRHDLLFTLWDASSRQLHSGLTNTNNEDLGNFDLCMTIDAKVDDVEILGKYCPYQWASQLPKSTLEDLIVTMEEYNHPPSVNNDKLLEVQNYTFKNVVKSGAQDAESITIVGSLCIPDGCSPEEFAQVFNPYIIPVTYSARNATTNCFVKGDTLEMSTFEIGITICVGLILLIVVGTTAYHVWLHNTNGNEPHELVKAFSVLHNGEKLITISRNNPDQIQCIHGLRFMSMLWVIAGHTFACVESLPLINMNLVSKWRSHLYAQYILAGPYAVDTFFFLSGLLLAYGYMKQMKGVDAMKQASSVPLMIVQRYLRLTPAAAALFFVSLALEPLGNGPLWIMMLNIINRPCRENWWRYFLYIQNYYKSSDICYTQTWYLSADMQMFVVAPLVLIPSAIYFRKSLRTVISSLVGLIIFCVGLTIAIRYIVDDYTNDYDTHSRLSDYLVGIIGGIIMHTQRGKDIKINKVVNLVIWLICLSIMLFLILYLHDIIVNPTKDKESFFYPIQRPIWCTCILWMVFSSHNGYGGIINRFLSNSFFQIGSRLSYCMYIIHATVILYYSGQIRTYQFMSDYSIIYWLCGNVVFCMVIATIWTFMFEAPMIILTKMIFGKLGSPKK